MVGGCDLGEVTSLSGSKYSPSSFIWTAEILPKKLFKIFITSLYVGIIQLFHSYMYQGRILRLHSYQGLILRLQPGYLLGGSRMTDTSETAVECMPSRGMPYH